MCPYQLQNFFFDVHFSFLYHNYLRKQSANNISLKLVTLDCTSTRMRRQIMMGCHMYKIPKHTYNIYMKYQHTYFKKLNCITYAIFNFLLIILYHQYLNFNKYTYMLVFFLTILIIFKCKVVVTIYTLLCNRSLGNFHLEEPNLYTH